ncbi:MAG: DUF86 domain-containing protein [Anaerolineales bacterium]|nr:DUF86 domain-containing protein [Anaerolineales bacterium]
MKKTSRDHLEDIQHELTLVMQFIQEGKNAFLQDARTQYAVMMAYARIGEIVKQIPDEVLARQAQMEWREIKGFRDVLIHRYFDVNMLRVWEAVEKLPVLQMAVETLLDTLPTDDESDDTP